MVDGIDRGAIGERLTNGFAYVTNVGVTPATLLKVHAQWLIVETLPLENPALTALDTSTAPVEMRPSSFVRIPLPDHAITTADHASLFPMSERGMADDLRRLFLIGYIKYSDSLGLRRRYYAYRFSPKRNRFVQVKQPNYNYED
ncbi:MAG TPA: hypothetical protein VI485_06500 [Vicinamibacterales bacterium]|nr:hypothetical protein [Vicinamibacterales bacterium]